MLDPDQVAYEYVKEPEDIPIKGNASCIDPETDAANERVIFDRVAAGDDWAWFSVKVVASTIIAGNLYRGESAWLGCNCYENEADFLAGGYYDDLKDEALTALENTVSDAMNVPNLDAMPVSALSEYRRKLTRGEIVIPLPEKMRKVTVTQLSAYCKAKVRAIRHRLAGRIDQALLAEKECEKRYSLLPDIIRW
jgi:hypothetical protein